MANLDKMEEYDLEDLVDEELQKLYATVLKKHNINHGDIEPLLSVEFEKAENRLKELIVIWVNSLKGGN